MKTSPGVLFALAALLAAPPATWPADEASDATPPAPEAAPPKAEAAPPKGEPAPTRSPPAPAQAGAQAAPEAQPVPPGQWVHTQQYGWVWMPYADSYTWVPPDGYGQPYQYVYYPAFGWTWVVAPWVWGWGPWPYFGTLGPWSFAWYGYGWWRYPRSWQYVPYRSYPYPGVRPAPSPLRPPAIRGAPAPHRGAWTPQRPVPGRSGLVSRALGGGARWRGER